MDADLVGEAEKACYLQYPIDNHHGVSNGFDCIVSEYQSTR